MHRRLTPEMILAESILDDKRQKARDKFDLINIRLAGAEAAHALAKNAIEYATPGICGDTPKYLYDRARKASRRVQKAQAVADVAYATKIGLDMAWIKALNTLESFYILPTAKSVQKEVTIKSIARFNNRKIPQ
jgi:hypothetical protein